MNIVFHYFLGVRQKHFTQLFNYRFIIVHCLFVYIWDMLLLLRCSYVERYSLIEYNIVLFSSETVADVGSEWKLDITRFGNRNMGILH